MYVQRNQTTEGTTRAGLVRLVTVERVAEMVSFKLYATVEANNEETLGKTALTFKLFLNQWILKYIRYVLLVF